MSSFAIILPHFFQGKYFKILSDGTPDLFPRLRAYEIFGIHKVCHQISTPHPGQNLSLSVRKVF